MSIGAEIIKDLGNNEYVIKVEPVDTKTNPIVIGVCHDYALFSTYTHLIAKRPLMIKSESGGSCNVINIKASVQIPIRVMGEIVMPMLNNNKYLKEEHFSNYGVWNEDMPVKVWSDSKTIFIYDKTQKKYVEIPVTLYDQLTNKQIEEK